MISTQVKNSATRSAVVTVLAAGWCLTGPGVALASEAKPAEGASQSSGMFGPPLLYTIQWSLLLLLLAITVVLVLSSLAPEMHRRAGSSRAKTILAFSTLQILLVFTILILNFLGEGYYEPPLPGYVRHVTLMVTGILLAVSGLMARRRRV